MESLRVMDAGTTPSNDGLVQLCNNLQSEERSIGFLEDLESYLQEINDRLTISRMVSDSVIRGIVNAIKEEADEKIAQKELEVAGLKKMLHLHHVDTDKNESLGPCLLCDESKISTYHKMYYNFPDAFVENDRMREYLDTLRNAAEDQFKMLKKEIDRLRGPSSIRRITSGSELLGLGGILQDKVSERRTDADIMLENLKATIDTVCKQVDDMLQLPKASFCAWQQEQEFQDDIEGMVIKNCIRSLQEEFEERLWDQNARLCGNESVDWLEKLQEVSNLRQELDAISKSLSVHEIGQLTSLGSLEIGGEWNNNKRTDNFNRKVLSNHVSSSTLAWEGNGKHEDTNANAAENSDPGKLKSMSKDKLVAEMTQMRRNHESKVQDLTEENIRLKGELLKLQKRGSSLPSEKDKEFEMLKKKIPNFISKLDDILMKNGNLLAFNGTAENLSSLKERLESLLSENRQLRDLLSDKKKEVNCLSSQVSDAEDKMSQHHLIEANLEHAIEDAHIKDSIIEDVYKCVLRELLCQIKCITEESDLRCNIMLDIYELLFSEAVCISQPANKYEIEDSGMDSIIAQTLCGIIFREALKDAEEKISSLNTRYINEKEQRVSLEVEAVERKEALRLEFLEKGRLQQEIRSLVASVAEKEKLVRETTAALAKEKEQFELASQELENSRDQTNRLQSLLLERGKEENIINGNLVQALKEIAQYKEGMCELNKKLETIDEEKGTLHEEKLKALSLVKVKEMEHRKQMESLVQGLLKSAVDFENRVMENVSNISLRLEKLVSESCMLIPNAVGLRRMGLSYKQKLERRCSDLEKAEAEVDLLGDEVDALLSLLEKIYIALDHYSPILQHYPGITEILKLVKRELSGECTKVV